MRFLAWEPRSAGVCADVGPSIDGVVTIDMFVLIDVRWIVVSLGIACAAVLCIWAVGAWIQAERRKREADLDR